MKVLLVDSNDDFGATHFENEYGGVKVIDIINNIDEYRDEDYYDLTVYEFTDIDPTFVKFIKTYIQDYDDSKNINFYLETDIIE